MLSAAADTEGARQTWLRARQIEHEVPGCSSLWWGRNTGLWLALVHRGSVRVLVEAETLTGLAALLGWQEAAR